MMKGLPNSSKANDIFAAHDQAWDAVLYARNVKMCGACKRPPAASRCNGYIEGMRTILPVQVCTDPIWLGQLDSRSHAHVTI